MEIIDELEPTKRGPYAGVVGYVDFSGNLDTAIAIRTMVWRDGHASVQAGAGIVADSVAADEDLECRNKARALLTAAAAARDLEPTRHDRCSRVVVRRADRGGSWSSRVPTPRRSSRRSCRRTSIRSRSGETVASLLLAAAGQARRRVPRHAATGG